MMRSPGWGWGWGWGWPGALKKDLEEAEDEVSYVHIILKYISVHTLTSYLSDITVDA